MDINEIDEMKELGVVKRKSEGPGEYEYTFKVNCGDCGKKVEWCYGAKSLEDVKNVLISEKMKIYCDQCQFKPKNLSHAMLSRVSEKIRKEKPDLWTRAVTDMWEELADGYGPEPHELDDGTEFWDTECPVSYENPDQTEE